MCVSTFTWNTQAGKAIVAGETFQDKQTISHFASCRLTDSRHAYIFFYCSFPFDRDNA